MYEMRVPYLPTKGAVLVAKEVFVLVSHCITVKGMVKKQPLLVLVKWLPISSTNVLFEWLGLNKCFKSHSPLGLGHSMPCQTNLGQTVLPRGKGEPSLGFSRTNKPLSLGSKAGGALAA